MMSEDAALFASLATLTPELKGKLLTLLAQDNSIPRDNIQTHEITSLRKSNSKLQQDFHKTLSDFRNAEKLHKEQIATLDSSLSILRAELALTLTAKNEEESKRKRYIKEKMQVLREKNELNAADHEMILDLQFKVRNLDSECSRIGSEKKALADLFKVVFNLTMTIQTCKAELEATRDLLDIEQAKSKLTSYWAEECEKQAQMVQFLEQELEYQRAQNEAIQADHEQPSSSKRNAATKLPDANWEWSAWMDRSWNKLWEKDIAGLQNEIHNLSVNKSLAISRIQTNLSEMVEGYIPVKSILLTGSAIASGDMTSSLLTPKTLTAINLDVKGMAEDESVMDNANYSLEGKIKS